MDVPLEEPPKIIKYAGLPKLSRREIIHLSIWHLVEILVQVIYGAALIVLWVYEYKD